MIIKEYKELESVSRYKGEDFKKYMTCICVDIANGTSFPTDYMDVYEHLFGKDEFLKLFLVDDDKVKGFVVSDGYFNNLMRLRAMYVHGIIIDTSSQGYGYFNKLVSESIRRQGDIDYASLRTHNPRCASSFINVLSSNGYDTYPNMGGIPKGILELSHSDKYIGNSDDLLVVRNAYERELLQQDVKDKSIYSIFDNNKLDKNDAQCVIGVKKSLRKVLSCERRY